MKRFLRIGALAALVCAVFAANSNAASPTLTMGNTGLAYTADAMGNTISDFSYVGYKGGTAPIPTLAVKKIISPVAGDNTSNIQAAINAVAAMAADANGFRGAVYLNAGTYLCSGTLSWSAGGVVLRGAGNGTIIQATGAARTFITVQGSGSASKTGSTVSITDTYMPGGTKTFSVTSVSGFGVGTNVVVNRPWVQAWITDIHMDDLPGHLTSGWSPGTGLQFERTITAINGTQVTVDIPIPNPIETTAYGMTGGMWAFTDSGRIQYSGIENLQLQGAFSDVPVNELNSLAANFSNCKNCWMRNVFVNGYGNGLTFGGTAKWCTITHCDFENTPTLTSSDPPAAYTLAGQLSLCSQCTASNGLRYHLVVTQGSTAGPNVFVDCTASGAGWRDSGPHQKWASGVLFDRMVMTSADNNHCVIAMENRGDDGSGQGWAQGFSVLWNCQAPQISLREPSYAMMTTPQYNWVIGGLGSLESGDTEAPVGEQQSFGTLVQPGSLYLEQLRERLGSSALQNIGYSRFTGNNKILAHHDNSAVIVRGALTADNTPIIQQAAFPNTASAKWAFVDVGGGRFEIKDLNSGKALAAQTAAPGALVVQTTYTGNGLDQWTVTDVAGSVTKIVNRASGLALEVPGSATADNTQLDQNAYTGAANQQFSVLPVP